MSRILIVDDDPNIRELVRVFLRDEGFDVSEASDGVEALARLERLKADMVILDVMMPNMDGWELCRELRASYDVPLLMLTAKGETAQKIKGFQLGTDDYLVKPFEPLELVARVKALLKRYRIATSQTVHVRKLLMDRKTFEVDRLDRDRSDAERQPDAVHPRAGAGAAPGRLRVWQPDPESEHGRSRSVSPLDDRSGGGITRRAGREELRARSASASRSPARS